MKTHKIKSFNNSDEPTLPLSEARPDEPVGREVREETILSNIPQRPPFVMVDKILSSGGTGTRTSFIVRKDNIFVEDGKFKEPGLVENIAQTAAAGASYFQAAGDPARIGYIGAIKNLEIVSFPEINDELITEVIILHKIFDVSLISGRVMCKGSLVAQCEMKIFITNQ